MPILYKPAGKAQEYAESAPGANDGYAINMYKGCTHGCEYCYCTLPPWMSKDTFHASLMPKKDVLYKLEKELEKLHGMTNPVHLCFVGDPYPKGYDNPLTRQVLELLAKADIKNVQILTKGGFQATRDFDIIAEQGWSLGVSLVWFNDKYRKLWEPGAASVIERLASLRMAKNKGIRTWLSIEPVIDCIEALHVIDSAITIGVDHYKIGKINHGNKLGEALNAIERDTPWGRFRDALEDHLVGQSYLIKKSLKEWEPKGKG